MSQLEMEVDSTSAQVTELGKAQLIEIQELVLSDPVAVSREKWGLVAERVVRQAYDVETIKDHLRDSEYAEAVYLTLTRWNAEKRADLLAVLKHFGLGALARNITALKYKLPGPIGPLAGIEDHLATIKDFVLKDPVALNKWGQVVDSILVDWESDVLKIKKRLSDCDYGEAVGLTLTKWSSETGKDGGKLLKVLEENGLKSLADKIRGLGVVSGSLC